MKEGTKVYRLDAIEAKPTTDVLSVNFVHIDKEDEIIAYLTSYLFKVFNETANHTYYVSIIKNSVGDYVVVCTCPARTICKHCRAAKELFEQIREGLEKL